MFTLRRRINHDGTKIPHCNGSFSRYNAKPISTQVPKLTYLLGIGAAVCEYLLKAPQSSNLVIVARGKQPLDEIKARYPDQVQVLAGDLTDYSLGKKAVDLAVSKWGKLDGMVLNHGTLGPVDKIANNDPNDWRSCFETNLFSSIAFVSVSHSKHP